MRRPTRLLAPTLLAALLLAGCTTPAPMPSAPPSSDATPVFASDEEALAAAQEAYGKYIATVDAIFADGGTDPERLEPLASRTLYQREAEGFAKMAELGWRGVGQRTFILTLQRYDASTVTVYSCENVSATDIVDATGTSVVTPDRLDFYQFVIELAAARDAAVVQSKDVWEGGGVC